MMDYALQEADEVPKPTVTASKRERPRKFPFHEMKVRDMFFAAGAKPTTMMSLACATGKRLNVKFETRRQIMRIDPTTKRWVPCNEGDEGAQAGVGVYRTA
jgi:hypothetical protein